MKVKRAEESDAGIGEINNVGPCDVVVSVGCNGRRDFESIAVEDEAVRVGGVGVPLGPKATRRIGT